MVSPIELLKNTSLTAELIAELSSDQIPELVEGLKQISESGPAATAHVDSSLHGFANWMLAVEALLAKNRHEDALLVCEGWLKATPNEPVAVHFRASLTGDEVPDRAAPEAVRRMFDHRAADYDAVQQESGYNAPAMFGDLLKATFGVETRSLSTVEIGCGTGLVGSVLRRWSQQLTGVDLSGEMIERARQRGVYDNLIQQDCLTWLQEHESSVDLIVAVDVVPFFGSVDELFPAALAALREKGWLMFTADEGGFGDEAWRLTNSGQYRQGPPLLMRTLGELGVPGGNIRRMVLRTVDGQPQHSLLVAVQKPEVSNQEEE